MADNKLSEHRPVTYHVARWYGLIMAWMFILYGGVRIILGILDRNYEGVGQEIIFLLIGVLMLLTVIGLRMLKEWGWYGQILVNGLIIVLALFGLKQPGNIALLILSVVALGALLAPTTKLLIFRR